MEAVISAIQIKKKSFGVVWNQITREGLAQLGDTIWSGP